MEEGDEVDIPDPLTTQIRCSSHQKGQKWLRFTDFYLWGEDYVKYLKGKHGFRSEIGEQGGDDCMEVDRGQQVAMPATAIEEEEDRT